MKGTEVMKNMNTLLSSVFATAIAKKRAPISHQDKSKTSQHYFCLFALDYDRLMPEYAMM